MPIEVRGSMVGFVWLAELFRAIATLPRPHGLVLLRAAIVLVPRRPHLGSCLPCKQYHSVFGSLIEDLGMACLRR